MHTRPLYRRIIRAIKQLKAAFPSSSSPLPRICPATSFSAHRYPCSWGATLSHQAPFPAQVSSLQIMDYISGRKQRALTAFSKRAGCCKTSFPCGWSVYGGTCSVLQVIGLYTALLPCWCPVFKLAIPQSETKQKPSSPVATKQLVDLVDLSWARLGVQQFSVLVSMSRHISSSAGQGQLPGSGL